MAPQSFCGGYLVLTFETNNSGVWLMHCHIGWYTEEGLALQFIEQEIEIQKYINYSIINSNYQAWDSYTSKESIVQGNDRI